MPGDEWQKFANLRLLLGYMICYPGKKLLFMGGDLGQWHEWSCHEQVHWELLCLPYHWQLQRCAADLFALYRRFSPLFVSDFSPQDVEVVFCDAEKALLAILRKDRKRQALCVHHFSPIKRKKVVIPLGSCAGQVQKAVEIFTSDRREYGGYGTLNREIAVSAEGLMLDVAPLATVIVELLGPFAKGSLGNV